MCSSLTPAEVPDRHDFGLLAMQGPVSFCRCPACRTTLDKFHFLDSRKESDIHTARAPEGCGLRWAAPITFTTNKRLFRCGKKAGGTIRFHRKASAAKPLAESSRPQGGKNRISCRFLLESGMEKYRFIHVSWKGPTEGRKDSGYGCQRAAWMESDFLLPCKSDKENYSKGTQRYTQGHPHSNGRHTSAGKDSMWIKPITKKFARNCICRDVLQSW